VKVAFTHQQCSCGLPVDLEISIAHWLGLQQSGHLLGVKFDTAKVI
jgi:hypothetical protein